MLTLTHSRRTVAVLMGTAVAAAATVLTASAAGAVAEAPRSAPTGPPAVLTGARITRRPGTLGVGRRVPARDITSTRVFSDARHGLALAHEEQADYPVISSDGGSSWRTAGPALHVDAADGPDGVSTVGVAGRHVLFVWGTSVIDASPDGGHNWYRVRPEGFVVAVTAGLYGIAAQVQQTGSGQAVRTTVQYVSTDGGRSWHRSRQLGG
jgi:hypothetical protein